jgi:transcription initiation factor TFIIIB Brf1 subunit/transcription initiation factor TFIIB
LEPDERDLVHDSRSGDTICTACAKVVEAYAFDQRPEWYGESASRAGPVDAYAPFLGSGHNVSAGRHTKYQEPDPHKTTRLGLKEIERCGAILRLDPNHQICMYAKQLYTDFTAARKAEGCCIRESQRPCAAACALYYGCKLAGVGTARTIAEIAAATSLATDSCIDMTKLYRHALVGKPYHDGMCSAVQPEDVLMRALETVEFAQPDHKRAVIKTCHTLFKTVHDRHALEGRRPETVCAAVMYRAFEHLKLKTTREAIFKACGITNATLKKALKDWTV